jgi:hypothetical protein
MWQRVVLCASLLGVAALIGCGSSPTAPSDPGLSELTSAPTRIEADGTALTLVGHLNRDFMPPIQPGGGPLLAVRQLGTDIIDGTPSAGSVHRQSVGSGQWAVLPTAVRQLAADRDEDS